MKKMRMKTRDVAFAYRMGAGFPGDVNRTHPASIEPVMNNTTTPVTAFGQPVLVDTATSTVRPFAAGDQSDTVAAGYGIAVRPYPFQQAAATNFGQADLNSGGPSGAGTILDILRAGYIMVKLPAGVAVTKGLPVYVWAAASSGAHVLGGIEGAFSSGNTTKLLNATFNGAADANGNVEIEFNV